MTHFEKAIKFIKDNRSWSDAEESVALQRIIRVLDVNHKQVERRKLRKLKKAS